jgi:hypothetical protein
MKRILLLTLVVSLFMHTNIFCQKMADLASEFANPPVASKPYVWWHWMGSNFSKTGITKDLEAMKASGIGGAVIFNLGSEIENNPFPQNTYRGTAYWETMRHALAEAKRLEMRISLLGTPGYSTTGGPWIDLERGMKKVVWNITETDGGREISLTLPPLEGGSFGHDIAVYAVPVKESISLNDLIDLSGNMDKNALLNWKAPEGKWKIYRFGNAPTGKAPHPIPEDLVGHTYEVDKMSPEFNQFNWEQVLAPIKEHLGDYIGNTLKSISIDSYESGRQNWTPKFREEFIKRKGYDPVPWLVTLGQPLVHEWFLDSDKQVCLYQLTGPSTYARVLPNPLFTIVGSAEETKRFEWDYRDVVSNLFFDNGWNVAKRMVNEANLEFWQECYRGPFDRNQGVMALDLPMVEFWTVKGSVNAPSVFPSIPASARAAGKTIVGAEALTGGPEESKWTEDPAFLKIFADEAFAQGVNKFMLHHWVQQPFDDKYQPGRSMGPWGTHFGRYQTWFEPGKAFVKYLGRCQYLLQQGEQVMDYLCMDVMVGESDVIAKDVFLQSDIKVKEGKIVLPSGREYLFMVFPRDGEMLPEVAQKIKDLVADGATIVSTRPVKSPSLKDYPQCEESLRKLADEVWRNGKENKYKKGYIFSSIEDARARLNYKPDYIIEKSSDDASKILVLHRQRSDMDIYYVTNQSRKAQIISLSFRISGKQPELWQAEDATICDAPVWHAQNGRTNVDIQLKGIQSVFVVFRKDVSGAEYISKINDQDTSVSIVMNKLGKPVLRSSIEIKTEVSYSTGKKRIVELHPEKATEIKGKWTVSFAPKLDKPFEMEFPGLVDFSRHNSKQVNYFSGTATYQKNIRIDTKISDKRIVLDLGELNDIAEVKVNGKEVGILWYPPYKTDITDYLREGENELSVAVTNNWANRLIGDEQEPRDFEVGENVDWGFGSFGCQLKSYPDWFIKNQPRPSQGRKAFTTWQYFTRDSPLKPAGLAGPVHLVYQAEFEL